MKDAVRDGDWICKFAIAWKPSDGMAFSRRNNEAPRGAPIMRDAIFFGDGNAPDGDRASYTAMGY